MRFGKRIRLGKGVHLNLSKSGIGISAGVKGLRVSSGPRGNRISAGIPGTKLRSSTSFGSQKNRSVGKQIVTTISINENGEIEIKYKDGTPIIDERLLRKVKRQEQYKNAVRNLNQQYKEEKDNEVSKVIDIFLQTEPLILSSYWETELNNLKQEIYQMMEFEVNPPTEEEVMKLLRKNAKKLFRNILFWKNPPRIKQHIADNIEDAMLKAQDDWKASKKSFVESEKQKKNELDSQYEKEYFEKKDLLNQIISGDTKYVHNAIEEKVKDINLPVDFAIDFKYEEDLYIDLDLPEIEDLPSRKVNILTSGKLSIKDKNVKERNYDYAKCVCGLAFYFTGKLFNISPHIQNIIISGYSQRLSTKTGNIEDQYLYSINFKRNIFIKLNIQSIDPVEAINNFEMKIKMAKNYKFAEINPYEPRNRND